MGRIAALACAGMLLWGCGIHGPSHACGTEVPDHDELAGCAETADGVPVMGARVIAMAHEDAKRVASDSAGLAWTATTTTDSSGHFEFGDSLARGHYSVFIQDSAAETGKLLVQRVDSLYHGPGPRVPVAPVRLVPPSLLLLGAKDGASEAPLEGATCEIPNSPYLGKTGKEGMVGLLVPPGEYAVSCILAPFTGATGQVSVEAGGQAQATLRLFLNPGESANLPPPEGFDVAYDEYSGMALLTWSPVTDRHLIKYGIRKIDIGIGGGADEISVSSQRTSLADNPFLPQDSVQSKDLLYSVYSLMREPGGYVVGSKPYRLLAKRPWILGARLDSLVQLRPDSAYRAGDTVRFAASFENRLGENDTLFWRVKAHPGIQSGRPHPPAQGTDTLAFVLPAPGSYEISLTVKDSRGNPSWLARTFAFPPIP